MNKETFLNKTVAIFVLSILLALAIGIGFAISHEGRDKGGERGNQFSEMGGGENGGQINSAYYDDHNQNPNDAEVQDDQATTTASTTINQIQKVK